MNTQDGSRNNIIQLFSLFTITLFVAIFGVFTSISYGDTEINKIDALEQSKVTNIAQRILDGSFVDFLVNHDKIINSQSRGLLNIPMPDTSLEEMVVFSGDIIVLDERTLSNGQNIVISRNLQAKPVEDEVEIVEVEEEPLVEETPVIEDGVPTNYVSYIDCKATAYCLCQKCTGKTPGSSGYGRTASGYVITPGKGEKIIAVDRKMIALGTNVYIQGLNGAPDYGYALAADTGGAIKGNIIDLYFDSHSDCLKWGRRTVRVYILPNE